MIGGYIYSRSDKDLEATLQNRLDRSYSRVDVWDNGFLFFNNPFQDKQMPYLASDELIVLSEDILVTAGLNGEYRLFDLRREFPEIFLRKGIEALNTINSDFRMVVLSKTNGDKTLFLVSNRAGSGRVYYHRLESGVLFSSDLRFLLAVVSFEVNHLGIYSVLKYGAIPEPMTISNNISAVPAAHYLRHGLNRDEHFTRPFFRFQFALEEDRESSSNDEAALDTVRDALQKSSRFLGKYRPAMLLSGGIDSSLYGGYLSQTKTGPIQAFYCSFGGDDPELQFALTIAQRLGTSLQVAIMNKPDALRALDDVTQLTDHPFSDFSSLPIAFLLKYIKEHLTGGSVVIECNGGDDCFGFPDLLNEQKFAVKHRFPRFFKKVISSLFKNSAYWKWESFEGSLARIAALADVHEVTPLNYFLVVAPVNYLGLQIPGEWDERLQEVMESVFSSCGEEYSRLGYEAKTTIRQLLHVNSRRWAAKALSVGESLGLRLIYPYIWHEILVKQGNLPWSAKVHDGIIKWPLKKLLEEFMPPSFIYRKKSGFVPPFARWLSDKDFNGKVRDILLKKNGFVGEIIPSRIVDELLSDALEGKRLRFPVLEVLWGAIITESWIRRYRRNH